MPGMCVQCHQGGSDFPLGFNYLQLSSAAKAVNIFTLRTENKFTAPPVMADEIPGNANDKAAIGYIQGNCAHCHNGVNQARNFRHNSNVTEFNNEPIILALANQSKLIIPGSPETSYITLRFQGLPLVAGGTAPQRMPRIGSNIIDPVGLQVLSTWITSITLP